ncbi:MAG: efflux RND transporter permease subunit, partial [Chloroflexi bacterium]|nr:efflux RND transporter permease subunit [Chloroflexota bacterium]
MWFTRLSIQRPVFVVVFMLTILVLGFRSLTSINVDLNPSINFPVVSIATTYPGTSSEEMETTVSKPIEDAVSSITGIQHINSTSQYGRSNVTIQFYLGVDANQAESDVREKVDAAKGSLPRDVNPPVVSRFDFSDQPVLTVGMRTDMSLKQARFEAQKIIEPLVSQVSGVARVDVVGGDTREIQVNADRAKLAAYGLSIVDLANAIQSSNMNVAAGHITEGRFDFDARVLGELTSIDQLRNLRLPVPSKDPTKPLWIRLSDIATVDDTVAERSDISRIWDRAGDNHSAPLKGSESVSIVVTKSNDANTAQVADGAKKVLAGLEKTLPGHTHFVVNVDQSTLVKDQLKDIVVALVAGALLAVLVVFLFLHDIRGTLICATAIPISLIATFIPMYFAGFTLNSMTMMALSLVVGILVDDSIVVLENVFRHLQRGEQPAEAAYNGRSEIGLAAITITFVDVAVFLPMAWMGGIVGQFFRQFGLTVACATLFSLLVSFSVTPMLASRLYRSSADVEHQVGSVAAVFERFYQSLDRGYHGLIARVLRYRALVVIASVILLAGVLFVFGPKLGFQFTPVTDQGQIVVTAELPAGTALAATDALVRVIEQRMTGIPEVESMFTSIGSLSGGTSSTPALGPQYAQVQLKLYDKPSAL